MQEDEIVRSAQVSECANNAVAIRRITSSPKGWPRRGSKNEHCIEAQRPGARLQTRGRIPRVGKAGKVSHEGCLRSAVLALLADDLHEKRAVGWHVVSVSDTAGLLRLSTGASNREQILSGAYFPGLCGEVANFSRIFCGWFGRVASSVPGLAGSGG